MKLQLSEVDSSNVDRPEFLMLNSLFFFHIQCLLAKVQQNSNTKREFFVLNKMFG